MTPPLNITPAPSWQQALGPNGLDALHETAQLQREARARLGGGRAAVNDTATAGEHDAVDTPRRNVLK